MKRTKISKQMRWDDSPYNYETENYDTLNYSGEGGKFYGGISFYNVADNHESVFIFDFDGFKPEEKLKRLIDEIHIRIKITKLEIFKIGELLWMAKKICREQKLGFKDWIADNFDFSYETANNFMNVFKYCFARKKYAVRVPTSILYNISSPSFPDELRECLFDNEALTDITNGNFRSLVDRYKSQGFDAVEKEIEEISRVHRIDRQIRYTFDCFKNCQRLLDVNKIKMQKNNEPGFAIDFHQHIKSSDPIAAEVRGLFYDAVVQAINILDEASEKSHEIYNHYIESSKKIE